MKQLLKIISFGSIGALTTVLVTATLFENIYGSSFTAEHIYHSLWFIALWALLAVTAMAYIFSSSRRFTLVLLHASFVMVLLGALVSFLTSKRGDLTISEDGAPASMFEMSDGRLERLPFRLQLTSIDTIYTHNSGQHSDYKAYILIDNKKESITLTASLNRPMKFKGYSFCIKGVADSNLPLLVSHDTAGRAISYAGYLMVFISFLLLFFDKQSGFQRILQQLQEKNNCKKKESTLGSALKRVLWRVLPVISILLCLLWWQNGVFPVTNSEKNLLLLAVVVATFAVAFRRTQKLSHLSKPLIILAVTSAIVGTFSLGQNDNIQPILRTPLLSIHVTVIIIAYALLCCTAINAIIALCTKNSEKRTMQALLGRALLYPATMFLAGGIFIGAVWANISWGRYWGWDPKEVWALITLLLCSIAFHTRSLRFISKPVVFHIFCIVAFATVLFTYFGVNYLLGGLHSYM